MGPYLFTPSFSRDVSLAAGALADVAPLGSLTLCQTQTKMAKMLWESNEPGPDGKTEDFGLGEVGEPRDCAGAVAFLCSPDARFMSGETLVMSGAVNSRL